MTTEETELTFIRCPGCRSLVPAVATRCRMCGFALQEAAEKAGAAKSEPATKPVPVAAKAPEAPPSAPTSSGATPLRQGYGGQAEGKPASKPASESAADSKSKSRVRQKTISVSGTNLGNIRSQLGLDDLDVEPEANREQVEEAEETPPAHVAREEVPRQPERPAPRAEAVPQQQQKVGVRVNRPSWANTAPEQAAPKVEEPRHAPAQAAQEEEFEDEGDKGDDVLDAEVLDSKPWTDIDRGPDPVINRTPVRDVEAVGGGNQTQGGESSSSKKRRRRRKKKRQAELAQQETHQQTSPQSIQRESTAPEPYRAQEQRREEPPFTPTSSGASGGRPVEKTSGWAEPQHRENLRENLRESPRETPREMPRHDHDRGPLQRGELQTVGESMLIGWFVTFDKSEHGAAREIRAGRFFIGSERVRGSDLVIDHNSVSTPHCLISASSDQGLRIQDLMSEHGTYIKRSGKSEYQRQSEPVSVEHGDWLRFGEYEVLVCVLPQGRSEK